LEQALHYLSISELSELFKAKQLSPLEVTRWMLERIDALDGRLKSYATVTAESALEQAAQAERERAAAGGKPRNAAEKKRWQRAKRQAAAPAGTINLSDPDSRLMKCGGPAEFVQGYNAQAVVDAERQIIVAADVTPQPHDHAQMAPLVQQTQRNLAAQPQTLSADAGYWSEESLAHAALAGIDVLVAPGSTNPRHAGRPLPVNAPRSERAQRMRERLASAPGRALYALRKAIVEPVFAYIKERRGFRRFSLRGLAQVRAEWALICLTHNLLKLHRHRMAV
jgi:hypothetical protein